MRHTLSILALLAGFGSPALAQDFLAPLQDFVEDLSPRQAAPNPAPEAPEPVAAEQDAEEPPPFPRPRPAEPEPEAEEPEEQAEPETERIYQTACPALLSGKVVGKMLPPIAEGVCGERSPLLIEAVNANGRTIPLSSPVTTNCEMAAALAEWAADVDAYAGAALDSPLAEISTGTSYMCRARVGGGEEFTSEHGFANAVDVVGFTLANGDSMSVEENWLPATAPEGKLLRQSHGAACGLFSTVLGPEANADHEDHLHLDLGCHGETCTAQLCE